MKLITPLDIFEATNPGQSTCLTIYVNSSQEISSCMAEARRVASADLTEAEVNDLLAPVRYLINNKKWNANKMATGIFVKEGFAGFIKIPFETKSIAVVAKSFHVKPILKWLQREKPFFLLHLDREKATLFQGSMSDLKPSEIFNYKKSRSLDFALDLVERSVFRRIQKTHQPLILSGEDVLTETYRDLCQYRKLTGQSVTEVSPDPKLTELHQSCIKILEPYLEKVEDSLVKKYWAAKARGSVSSNLHEIVSLALAGQVKHLFINETMNIWGKVDYRNGSFTYSSQQLDSHDDDILDDLAELVLFHRGSVTVLDGTKMPDSQAAAAILRPLFGLESKLSKPRKSNAFASDQNGAFYPQIAENSSVGQLSGFNIL